MKTRCARLSALLLVVCTIVACGQRGPLMLPGDPSSVETEIPGLPGPVQNDEDEEKDEDERDHGARQ